MAGAMEKTRPDRPLNRFLERFDPDRLAESFWPFGEGGRMRIEQQVTDDELIVRAELPGIDPENDVEITVAGDYLHLRAERRDERKEEDEGRTRSEFRYGVLARSVALPSGVNPDDVRATYRDGILEIHVPLPEDAKQQPRRIPVRQGA
jgi:HSP20 family protein